MRTRICVLFMFSILSSFALAQNADLAITVSDAPDPVTVGEELLYDIEVSNLGPDDATNVNLDINLDWRLTFVSATWSQGSCTPGPQCAIGDLSAGSSADLTVTVTTTESGTVTTHFNVGSDVGDPSFNNNSTSSSTTVTTSTSPADLSVTMVADPDPVAVGEELSFIMTVTNLGPGDVPEADLIAALPLEMNVYTDTISGPGFYWCNGGSPLQCRLNPLGAGTSTVIAMRGTPTAEGTFNSTVFVSSGIADSDSSNNTATATATITEALVADLAITVSDAPDPVEVGEELLYDIDVSNLGPEVATNVNLDINLDSRLTFVSATWSQGICTPDSSQVLLCAIGDLTAGSSTDLTVTVTTTGAGTVTTHFNVGSDVGDPSFDNNSTSSSTAVTTSPADLSVTMVADPDLVAVGEELSFIMTVTNLGPGNTTEIDLRATRSSGFPHVNLQTVSGSGLRSCSYGSDTPIRCELRPLSAGTSTVIAMSGMPTADGTFNSTVFVSSENADSDTSNNTATATATVTEALVFDLEVRKVGDGAGTVIGDTDEIGSHIDCGDTCMTEVTRGTTIEFSAEPEPGSVFSGWDGSCTGTDSCTLIAEADEIVTATFSELATATAGNSTTTLPAQTDAQKGGTDVPMLQFTITPDASSENIVLGSLTFAASGTGDDAENIVGVRVYVDSDGDGELDEGETLVAIGSYLEDNGEATLVLGTPLILIAGETTSFLVTYDLGTTLTSVMASNDVDLEVPPSGNGLSTLALMFPLAFAGTVAVRRSRRLYLWLLLAMMVAALSSCAQETGTVTVLPPPTHQVHLTTLTLTGADSAEPATLAGLPISGTVLTIHE